MSAENSGWLPSLNRRRVLAGLAAASTFAPRITLGQSGTFKIGFILPMTGESASTGRQVIAGARLWLAQNPGTVAGRQVELIVRDDTGVADLTRRIAQEMIVSDKVNVLAGFGLTPLAIATAPLATQGRTPMVVTAAAGAIVTEQSPFIVRASHTLPQTTFPLAAWATSNGIRRVVTMVSDYAPGIDAERTLIKHLSDGGGSVLESMRVPLRSPDFAPFLQRVSDAKADAVYVFVPSGQGAQLMKQFVERGMSKSGIRLIGDGGVTDDDMLDSMGDPALGIVTSHHYSADHPSAVNKAFVAAFQAANGNRPNFMAVHGYDGMHLICGALLAAGGNANGEALVEAMKAQSFESPRGPLAVDPSTRELIQNVYIRRVERKQGQLWNTEIAVSENVKDPGKAG